MMVIGELPVAPLGLSLLLRLAPPRFIGVVVGVWYGGRCTGLLAGGDWGGVGEVGTDALHPGALRI
jgi:POT family proton-dependent oligopeptide transporter